jgi:hypothetical protein
LVEKVDDSDAFLNTWRAGFAGVAAVELFDETSSGDICERFPGCDVPAGTLKRVFNVDDIVMVDDRNDSTLVVKYGD